MYEKVEVVKEKERAVQRLSYLANHDQNLQRYLNVRGEFVDNANEAEIESAIKAEV